MRHIAPALLLLFCLIDVAYSQPEISGPQSGTLGPGEYVVTGDLSIVESDTLIVAPGTTFIFDGEYNFTIDSLRTLICVGTEADSIRFMPNTGAGVTHWGHIEFLNSGDDDSFVYCLVTGGYAARGGGIFCENTDFTIANSSITGNEAWEESGFVGGGIYFAHSTVTLSYCSIRENSAFRSGGISCIHSDITISHCSINDNQAVSEDGGIGVDGGGIGSYYEDSQLTISYSTISGNVAEDDGGGVYCSGSQLLISQCSISGNTAQEDGGGIEIESSNNATISHCTINGNYARNYGGGIRPRNSFTTITDCEIHHNHANSRGGGIESNNIYTSFVTVTNCTIYDNVSPDGGGIGCSFVNLTITDCVITGNRGGDDGGGMQCINSHVSIFNSAIISNSAAADGGGINCEDTWDSATLTMIQCTINNNLTGDNGGGIRSTGGSDILISGCEIIGNIAETEVGGGISFSAFTNFVVEKCTIVGNSALHGAGIYCVTPEPREPEIINSIVAFNNGAAFVSMNQCDPAIRYCNVFGNYASFSGNSINPAYGEITGVNANGDPCDAYFNISIAPLFVDPLNGDFHLQEGSPCIDAGNPNSDPDPDSTIADIGAFYFDQSEMDVRDNVDTWSPHSWGMFSAYPNPFNPATTIRVDLPRSSELTVRVFNVNGQSVAKLADGSYQAGQHELVFDASHLASGLYFIHATVPGHFNQVQKMMLVR